MNLLDLKATTTTPAVTFGKDGKLKITGRSISGNEIDFYKPLITWAENLQIETLLIEINLEYLNSGSSKQLLYLFKLLDSNDHVKSISVKWYYDEGDEDNLMKGQVFNDSMHKCEFSFHQNANSL